MVSVGDGISTTTYAYNGLGDRLQTSAGGQTTRYTLDRVSGLTQVLDDGGYTYLYGNGRVAQYGAHGGEYFLGDALGSVRQLADTAGAVRLARSYQPYGELLASNDDGESVYGFTGEATDALTGMVYLRARWYAPHINQFFQPDPIEPNPHSPQDLNPYVYVRNSPINFTDHSGMCIDINGDGMCDFSRPPSNSPYLVDFEPAHSWTTAEKDYINAGALRIGRRFAPIINKYNRFYLKLECDSKVSLALYHPVTERQAFSMVFRSLTFRKVDSSCSRYFTEEMERTVDLMERQGKSKVEIENYINQNYAGVDKWTCWGSAYSKSIINVYTNAKTTQNPGTSQWAVHEMAHVFNQIVLRSGENYVNVGPDWLRTRGEYSGLASGQGLQQSGEHTPSEIFADMFLHWVYDTWEKVDDSLTPHALDREWMMNQWMATLIIRAAYR